ncbi:ETX/MTX2 family pore-forming toxin [Bacillus sp. BP-3]|uniref:ETX/MTX2 family pore-forming toxin n=1 Tax=Bacillus sp. BP-3 TaxID=3022773 RepID=UPI0023300328|nr:ETX/MTX2 family pore-forming toxin [Bacillus sp. BP-3]MDC2863876.1 ETX/MTX2 family pore-forming toxin [Bacillus sp. BP-3]
MKKSSKKTKQILSLAMIGAIGTSVAFASPNSASAAQISPTQAMAQEQESVGIVDWKEPFKKAYAFLQTPSPAHGLYPTYYGIAYKDVPLKDVVLGQVYQSSVEADGSPVITNSKGLFAGKTILNNDTDRDQVLTTDEFSKTFENSVTSSVTNGFNLGVTASASFGIPLIGETSVEISTEYNFSKTDENTKTESYTYTASPQNITVPAHSAVEVIVNLNTAKINGNVKLLTKLDGYIEGETNNPYVSQIPFYTIAADPFVRKQFPIKSVDPNSTQVYLEGKGKYSAEYGTEFSVTVRPVTKPGSSTSKFRSAVAGATKATNEGYTYKVKPEVKKEN